MRFLMNNQSLLAIALFATALLGASKASAGYGLHPAFHGGCDASHVIDLLARNGAGYGAHLPNRVVTGSPMGPIVMPTQEYGDLSIECIAECATDPACPPVFVVTVKNCSPRPVCNIQVSLVAMLGPIRPLDPTAVATIAEIPAGGLAEIKIELPDAALRMGANGGVAVGFQQLLVAIDSLDAYAELNEANNIQLLNRCDVPKQEVVVEPTEAVASPVETPATPVEETPAAAAPVEQKPLDAALEEFGLEGATNQEAAQRL